MAYSLAQINAAVRSDPRGFVQESDAAYDKKIEAAARKIAANLGKSRIVLLSGPSGSGKTTTAMKIAEELRRRGVSSHAVAMDNYFLTPDPKTAPRTPEGSIDYESPLCLDMELLSEHFTALSRGEFDLYLAEVVLTAGFDLDPLLGSGGGMNYGGWWDGETDALLSALRAAPEEGRALAAEALFARLEEQLPILPICFKNGSVLTQWGRLSGLSPVRGNVFYKLEEWTVNQRDGE